MEKFVAQLTEAKLNEWRNNLKVGDQVYFYGAHGRWPSKIKRIEKFEECDGSGEQYEIITIVTNIKEELETYRRDRLYPTRWYKTNGYFSEDKK